MGTLRTAGTLASPSCGREIQFYKVNSWIFTFRAPGDSRPSLEPILHKSRRKDLQVGQETSETSLNGLVVVREAGEQEAGKSSYLLTQSRQTRKSTREPIFEMAPRKS